MLRSLFHRHQTDEPCAHMVGLLNGAADGRLRGFARWYALAHAARCVPCGRFLMAIEGLVRRLHQVKDEPAPADVMERLRNGAWTQVSSSGD